MMMKSFEKFVDNERVIILREGILYLTGPIGDRRCVSMAEARDIIETNGWDDAEVYSLEQEIRRYRLVDDFKTISSDSESFLINVWRTAYTNRNIRVSKLPIKVESNEEYEEHLKRSLDEFLKELDSPAFVYDKVLMESVKKNCSSILSIFLALKSDDRDKAEKLLKEYLRPFIDDGFVVTDLDKSYAFRGVAPFEELHSPNRDEMYDKMMKKDLTFYRMRTKKKSETNGIDEITDIVHVPFNLSEKASEMRFNKAGSPCLYLGTTSFVCANECRWNSNDEDLFGAAFIPTEVGKKLKILNMVLSQHLSNGMNHVKSGQDEKYQRHIQNEILRLYPLVLAMSFSINDSDRKIKYEYLISQCLMDVIHEIGIDGIAYLSAQGSDEFQYPHGVNIALPAYDINADKPFSKYCGMFRITKPVKFENQDTDKTESYINAIYKKYHYGVNEEKEFLEDFFSKIEINDKHVFYGETEYAKFDNYLCSLPKDILDVSATST